MKQGNSKSNYEILQDNKTKVLEFANAVEPSNINQDEIQNEIKAKLDSAKTILSTNNFSEAISLLDEIKDNKLGIVWHKSKDLGNGTEALVRDARNVTNDTNMLKKDAGEKYAMQLLNLVRASIDLLNLDGNNQNQESKTKLEEKLKNIALSSLENIDSLPEQIKGYNSAIVKVLKDSGMEDVEKKLQFAKEIQNFKDEHKHIVTLSSVKNSQNNDVTIIEADIMLNGLTEKQKQEWGAIANSDTKKNEKDTLPNWYKNLDQYQQKLLEEHADEIAKGNKVIPTQLLSSVPGIKNGYLKVTAIEQVNGSDPKILLESLHCGTPATKIKNIDKDEQQGIVNENVEQLQSFVENDRKINLNILTSKTPLNIRGEDFISNQIYKTKKDDNVVVSSSPLNRWSWLGAGRDNKVFKSELKSIADSLKGTNNTKNVAKFLKNGSSFFENLCENISVGLYKSTETKAKNELKVIDSDLAKILKQSIEARKLIDSSNSPFAKIDVNLRLNSAMAIVENEIVKFHEKKLGNEGKIEQNEELIDLADNKQKPLLKNPDSLKNAIPVRVNFCKSGKDRTGLNETISSHEAICYELDIDPNSKKGLANLSKQVSGGHTQEMAGTQGGSVGCHTIKTNPEFRLGSTYDNVIGGIINQESSRFNSKIKLNKDPKKQDDFKQLLNKNIKIDIKKNQAHFASPDRTPNYTLSRNKKTEHNI